MRSKTVNKIESSKGVGGLRYTALFKKVTKNDENSQEQAFILKF